MACRSSRLASSRSAAVRARVASVRQKQDKIITTRQSKKKTLVLWALAAARDSVKARRLLEEYPRFVPPGPDENPCL